MIEVGTIINQMAVLVILMLLGILLGKLGIIDEQFRGKLSWLLMNVAQLGLIISSAAGARDDFSLGTAWRILALAVSSHAVLFALGVIFTRAVRTKREDRGTYKFMFTFGNLVFLGFPVMKMIYGDIGVVYAFIYTLPFNFICFSVGVMMIAGKDGARLDWKKIINPPFIGSIAALIIMVLKIPVPSVIVEPLSMLGGTTVPFAMLVIGASLAAIPIKRVFSQWRVFLMAPIKLVLTPTAVFFLFRFFTSDPLLLGMTTVMAAMPIAANATMFSIQYKGNEQLASSGVFITSLLSSVSVPLVYQLLLAGFV